MTKRIRSLCRQSYKDGETIIQITISSQFDPTHKFMDEISNSEMSSKYGHHLPPGIKFHLSSVDFKGELHYTSELQRRYGNENEIDR